MTYCVQIAEISQNEWELLARDFADYTVYQTWAYQRVRTALKGESSRCVVVQDGSGQAVSMAHMRIIRVPLARIRVGYIRWGPLTRSSKQGERLDRRGLLTVLKNELVPNHVDVLRLVPNAYVHEDADDWIGCLGEAGFRPATSVEPYHTMLFPVDIPEEEMSNRLHKKWRATLRKAEKQGMQVLETQDVRYLRELDKIYRESRARKGFAGLDLDEYIRIQELLLPDQKLNMIVILYEGEPQTIDVTSHLGDTATGLFQSSSEKGLQMGSSYLAWWHVLLAAKRAGMKRYDLGGVDPEGNPHVYQFKLRMGAEEARQPGGFEACSSGAVRRIWRLVERGYQMVKGR